MLLSPPVPCCLLLLLLTHRTHRVESIHYTILCAIPTTSIHCLDLSVSARHRLLECQSRGQSSPASRSSARRALSTHPSTPHPSDHQSPITHALTHHSLSSFFTKQHTYTIRTYLRTTLHTSFHHCYRSLSPDTHAYTPHQSPDRLYSALSSRSRSETASIPACFA
jgi:hypothetical protein